MNAISPSTPLAKIAQQEGVHALLLHGGDAASMSQIALSIAQGWMCPNSADGIACGECQVCRTVGQQEAIDLLIVRPTGASNWIVVSAITAVTGAPASDAQPVTRFVQSTPLVARCKVVIVERADRLRVEAANALLKTLEEPTPRVKFILTTSAISAVLPTIVSRCLGILVGAASDSSETSEMEKVLGAGSAGRLAQIQAQTEAYQAVWDFCESITGSKGASPLLMAERFRNLSDKFDSNAMGGARAANVELLFCLAQWLSYRHKTCPDLIKSVVKTHGAVLGNGSMILQLDPLFCQIARKIGG